MASFNSVMEARRTPHPFVARTENRNDIAIGAVLLTQPAAKLNLYTIKGLEIPLPKHIKETSHGSF